jgi:hypothetical protein
METQSLEHIIYASAATQDFTASQLAEILQKARIANERESLTGMLLHTDSDGSFFQVVEGAPDSIDRLLQKLKLDKRHSNLTLIIREQSPSGPLRGGPWGSRASRRKSCERSRD